MKFKVLLILIAGIILLSPWTVLARGVFEFSVGYSYNRSNYTNISYASRRMWGSSVAYHFSKYSGVEVSFSDVVEKTLIEDYQDTEYHDQVYSASWIQSLLEREQAIQPYFKLGLGQLNRDASGSYANGLVPIKRVDSLTVVTAAGVRVFVSNSFALRSEVTSYISGGSLKTWKDNIAIQLGISLFY